MAADEPLGLARKFVQQDRDAVDGAATLEVGLNLLWGRRVIDVTDKNAAAVDILLILR